MANKRLRETLAEHIEKQFYKYKYYSQMPENDYGTDVIDYSDCLKIADGIIPLVKQFLNEDKKPKQSEVNNT